MKKTPHAIVALLACAIAIRLGGIANAADIKHSQHSEDLSTDQLQAELEKDPDALHIIHGLRIKGRKGEKRSAGLLKAAFEKAHKAETKSTIAVALIQLGVKDDKYWDYIASSAKARIEDDMPMPLAYDAQGKSIRGKFSEDYLAWCKAKGVAPESKTLDALYGSQDDIVALSKTKDPRAIPILMRGLEAKNYMVVLRSAEGLALFQHKPAAEKIIARSEKMPAEVASNLAEYLVFFKDAKAQAAAEKLVKKPRALERRRKQAKELDEGKLDHLN